MRPRRLAASLPAQIVAAMVVGAVSGRWIAGDTATHLAALGKLVIDLIKAAATPLLFAAVVHAVATTDVRLRGGLRMVVISLLNGSLAMLIGLGLANLLRPGEHLSRAALSGIPGGEVAAQRPIDPWAILVGFVPRSWVQPFAENQIIPLVVVALLLGLALRRCAREDGEVGRGAAVAIDLAAALYRALQLILGWIIRLVPLAVFAAVAKASGDHGWNAVRGLAWYVGVGLAGMAIHVLVVYQGWIVLCGRGLRRFWSEAREPAIYALGANSSLATLPLTLRALDRLGVSPAASRLAACIGTNLNNDGIMLYEAMAAILVAQASGIDLSFGQQVLVVLASLAASFGVAGVPEAGFISLAVVLATVGLPAELLGILLSVDWIIARARSFTNVLGDLVVSIGLDRWERGAAAADPSPRPQPAPASTAV